MGYYDVCRGDAFHPGGYALTRRGISLCGFAAGARVCDIGCGTGGNIDRLRRDFGLRVTGIEPSEGMRGMRQDVLTGELLRLPLENGAADGVLCECVWSLCGEPEKALREINRVLKKDGRLILSDVYARGERPMTGQGPVGNFYTKQEIGRLLDEAGFAPLHFEDRSRELVTFAAQLILDGKLEGCPAHCGVSGKNCGYFLMIAAKR